MAIPDVPQGAPPADAAPAPGLDAPAARGFAAATAQIDLALREAQGPIDALGGSLEHVSRELATLRAWSRRVGADLPAADRAVLEASLTTLGVQLTTAVQSLQFYDRLFQHLSHVHDFLFGAADLLKDGEDPGAGDAAARWEQLRERLFRRLLSDAQRQLLDVVLPPRHWRADVPSRGLPVAPVTASAGTAPDPGDIELF